MRKPPGKKKPLDRLFKKLSQECKNSSRFKDSRPVFSEGNPASPLMIVGEAPGRDETRLGRPFVGRAGTFFTKILEDALGAGRGNFYITNTVKVWPHLKTKRLKTRAPLKSEIDFFLPYLLEEIRIVRPKVILAVGRTAFGSVAPEKKFECGAWTKGVLGHDVVSVYHPAYILRKKKDLKKNTDELRSILKKVKKSLGRKS